MLFFSLVLLIALAGYAQAEGLRAQAKGAAAGLKLKDFMANVKKSVSLHASMTDQLREIHGDKLAEMKILSTSAPTGYAYIQSCSFYPYQAAAGYGNCQQLVNASDITQVLQSTKTTLASSTSTSITATGSLYDSTDCSGTAIKTKTMTYPTVCTSTGGSNTNVTVTLSSSMPGPSGSGLKTIMSSSDTCGSPTSYTFTPSGCFTLTSDGSTSSVKYSFSQSGNIITETTSIYFNGGCSTLFGTSSATLSATCDLTGDTEDDSTDDLTAGEVDANTLYSQNMIVSGSSSPSSCFAGSELVTLESGATKPISEVQIGDRVLAADASGRTKFSEVVSVPHGQNQVQESFVRIQTVAGTSLKLTQEHLLLAGACGSQLPLTAAKQVSQGQCVLTVDGQEQVSAVDRVVEKGVYTVVTMEELVVVNGVIASPFAVSHAAGHLFYNLHRLAYAALPTLAKSPALVAAYQYVADLFMRSF